LNLTPLKAIRKKCLDCSAGSFKEVKLCPLIDCSLYLYRFGKNPHKKGQGRIENITKHKKTALLRG